LVAALGDTATYWNRFVAVTGTIADSLPDSWVKGQLLVAVRAASRSLEEARGDLDDASETASVTAEVGLQAEFMRACSVAASRAPGAGDGATVHVAGAPAWETSVEDPEEWTYSSLMTRSEDELVQIRDQLRRSAGELHALQADVSQLAVHSNPSLVDGGQAVGRRTSMSGRAPRVS